MTFSKNKSISTFYLFFYNFVETVGWSYILYKLFKYIVFPENVTLYESVKYPLFIFQNAAILEIVHSLIRLVVSSPIITLQQVSSRVMLVCGVLMASLDAQVSTGLPLALFAWSITEIIRYAYYALNLINAVPHILIWLRYTTFIVLYPIGVTGELLCLYTAYNEISKNHLWTVTLPNRFNFTFSYPYLLIGVMLMYIPLFPQLYMHMFTQRKKVLGKEKSTKDVKKVK